MKKVTITESTKTNKVFWQDEYGNRWNAEIFSEKDAEQYSKSLVGSKNCTDCINCEGCTNCISCRDCRDCVDCKYCAECVDCYNCDDCAGCTRETANCVNCINCSNCESCINCNDCQDCIDCENCSYLNNCTKCKKCTFCNHIDGYNNNPSMYRFMLENEDGQYTGEYITFYWLKEHGQRRTTVVFKDFTWTLEEFEKSNKNERIKEEIAIIKKLIA